ncbi:MAG: hypothetical protein A2W07_00430 [candidate division Zixibacteria bacterium RBG_16_43_9]|nr:MAG: hypothetical protein A2W07_00430 [candidate division Zixibacteria bacterium RBG_16_43_9]
MSRNKKIILFLTLVLLVPSVSQSGDYINYSLNTPTSGLAGNSVVEVVWDGYYLWVGTGSGLSRTSDWGTTWQTFDHNNGLNQDGISAIAFKEKDTTLWVATSYNQIIDGVPIPFGSGFNQTKRDIISWASSQPEQASGVGKLAYDMAISDTTVWAACFYGGLIRSEDKGQTWGNVFIDSVSRYDYENGLYQDFRNRVFAVTADHSDPDTTFIWSGTAAGIFKFIYTTSDTADTVIAYQHDDTISTTISGNFVISLGIQKLGSGKIIWAGTQPTYSGTYAASFSTDQGATWSKTLAGDKIWNFDFKDSVVWVATSSGLKRSTDLGASWKVFNYMQDKDRPDQQIWSTEFYAVRLVGDTIWAGNFDGLAMSPDNGNTWKVYRSFAPIGSPQATSSYAYPNPFSPMIANQRVRIHYKPDSDGEVTIKIYDFEMKLVKTILGNAPRAGGVEYDEVWDGKNEKGETVANGIYFFKIEGPGGQKEWGKIGVIK